MLRANRSSWKTLAALISLSALAIACSDANNPASEAVPQSSAAPRSAKPGDKAPVEDPGASAQWVSSAAVQGCEVSFYANAGEVSPFRWLPCEGVADGSCEQLHFPTSAEGGAVVAPEAPKYLKAPFGQAE